MGNEGDGGLKSLYYLILNNKGNLAILIPSIRLALKQTLSLKVYWGCWEKILKKQ
jgi:hypothetical protein